MSEATPATVADLQAMELRIRRALGHLTEAIEDLAEEFSQDDYVRHNLMKHLSKVRTYALLGIGEDDE